MSDFKTTPIKNSYELMIDRLKAVISDKDAELARLKAEVESLKWWQGHGQKLRNAIFTHLMDLPGKSVFEVPTSDDDVEAQPEKTAKELARLEADNAALRTRAEQAEKELAAERGKVSGLLSACQIAYRKHHLNDDSIGWDELGDILLNALCNVMGDEQFQKWTK